MRLRADELLGRPIVDVVSLRGGANSRVYRISDGTTYYAMKLYPTDEGDPRDRLGAEVVALNFLRRHDVGTVPAVVAVDREWRIGVYRVDRRHAGHHTERGRH